MTMAREPEGVWNGMLVETDSDMPDNVLVVMPIDAQPVLIELSDNEDDGTTEIVIEDGEVVQITVERPEGDRDGDSRDP